VKDARRDLDDLDELLERSLSSGDLHSELPIEIAALVRADAATPDADPAFIRGLRARIMYGADAESAPRLTRRIGIVATPIAGAPVPLSRAWFAPLAVAVALVLALFAFNGEWSGDGRHGFGIPTAQASTTVEAPSPTPTATPPQLVTSAVDSPGGSG
jgi:hypothetical protein